MPLSNISSRANTLLVEMFGIQADLLSVDKSLTEDLGLDSIDVIDLLTTLNDEFSLDLNPFDFEGCTLLGDFLERLEIKSVERKLKSTAND